MIYILAAVVAVGMAFILQFIFNIPFMATIIVAAVVIIVRSGYALYMTYKCKDLTKLSRFLEKSSNLLNYYFFTQKQGTADEQIKALDDVLKSYSSQIVQGQYKAQQAILQKNYPQALQHAKTIPNATMKKEAIAIVEAVVGKRSTAEQLAVGKPWFKHFILAIVAYRGKDMTAFNSHKEQCLQTCSGAQYFSNYYFLERIGEYVKK